MMFLVRGSYGMSIAYTSLQNRYHYTIVKDGIWARPPRSTIEGRRGKTAHRSA
jgi:hypothetical protein